MKNPEDIINSERVMGDSVESRITNGQILAEMEVGLSKYKVAFKVDTGSQVNILPYYAFKQLGVKTDLCPSSMKLSAYSGNSLLSKGTVSLTCTVQVQTALDR